MIRKVIVLILFSLSISQLDIVTIRFECDYLGDMGPNFFGFPFIYRTEIPWVNSLSGNFYVLGFIGNVIFYFLFLLLVVELFNRINLKSSIKKIIRIITYILTAILLALVALNLTVIDWEYKWRDTYFKNYGDQPLDCDKYLDFFKAGG